MENVMGIIVIQKAKSVISQEYNLRLKNEVTLLSTKTFCMHDFINFHSNTPGFWSRSKLAPAFLLEPEAELSKDQSRSQN